MKEEKQHYQAKRRELVLLMAEGHSYAQATAMVGQLLSVGMAKRLLRRYQQQGAVALKDRRQGHPSKFRGEIQQWLKEYCTQHPTIPSSQLQNLILAHFALKVSISQNGCDNYQTTEQKLRFISAIIFRSLVHSASIPIPF